MLSLPIALITRIKEMSDTVITTPGLKIPTKNKCERIDPNKSGLIQCTKCKKYLPATTKFFNTNKAGLLGLTSQCKRCLNEKVKTYKSKQTYNGICEVCGNTIIGDKKYCSRICWVKAVKREEKTCKHCGKKYIPKASDRTTYCSRDCYFAHKTQHRLSRTAKTKNNYAGPVSHKVFFKHCEHCGKLFTTKYNSCSICSDNCKKERYAKNARLKSMSEKTFNKTICKNCGCTFIPEYGDMRRVFCSKQCGDKYSRCSSGDNRKRARKFGVAYEYINPLNVLRRDGWVCQICGKATPENRRGSRYSNAPEMDHRIPLSKGGPHLYSNVQCVCRQCNGGKSNKNNFGNIPLFGVGSYAESANL